MTYVTVSGKTIEEAVSHAVEQLNVAEDKLTYKVVSEPKKGFFGFIGSKPAIIEARVIPDPVDIAHSFLRETLSLMKQDVTLAISQSSGSVLFNITGGDDLGRLIGKRGQTLESLEYLTNLVANRGEAKFTQIALDVEDYRERRKQILEKLALRVADQVRASNQSQSLEPMNAPERKIIHTILQHEAGVKTSSEGSGSNRKVVILPSNSKDV